MKKEKGRRGGKQRKSFRERESRSKSAKKDERWINYFFVKK